MKPDATSPTSPETTSASDPASPTRVAGALLAWLERTLQRSGLAWAEAPRRMTGGCHTLVWAFRLANAAPPYDGPLVLRILKERRDAPSPRLEAVIHDALIERGFPVPCVLAFSEDPARFGGAFQIMERVRGRPMMLGDFDPEERVGRLFVRGYDAALRLLTGDWPERLAKVHARLHDVDASGLCASLDAGGIPQQRASLAWRLRRLSACVETWGLEPLRPVIDWLHEHRPAGPPSLCHGDLFGNQVFEHHGRTAGVIDWTEAFVAAGEIDVGIVKAGIETVPFSLPGPLAGMGERVVRRLARRFVAAYRRERPLDPQRMRYGEVFRCASCLVAVAERRLARAGRIDLEPRPNPYDHPVGVARLCAHLKSITWAPLEPGCVEPALKGERA